MRSRLLLTTAILLLLGSITAAFGQTPAATQPASGQSSTEEAARILQDLYVGPRGGAAWLDVDANQAPLMVWSRVLGAELATVDAPLKAQLKLEDGKGYVIVGLKPEGPGAKAGLQTYDVLLGVQGQPEANKAYDFVRVRQGQRAQWQFHAAPAAKEFWIGVDLEPLSDALRTQLSLPEGRGVLVQGVHDQTPAQAAGLARFDVIVALGDGAGIGSSEDLASAIQKSDGKTMQLQIVRHAKSLSLNVTPAERPKPAAASDNASVLHYVYTLQPNAFAQARHQLHIAPMLKVDADPAIRQWIGTRLGAKLDSRQTTISDIERKLDESLKEIQAARAALEALRKQDGEPKKD